MNYSQEQIISYASALAKVASLSNLFSESKTPFIHYRATEYLYAKAFNAKNLARSDIAIDAKIDNVGIGLKTFVYNNRPKYEKIAEFNKELLSFNTLSPEDKIRRIAQLRNERIKVAGRITGADTFIYHCIARLPEKLFVFEQEMPFINSDAIKIDKVNTNGGIIRFTDGASKYCFNTSKSTLLKEFYSSDCLFEQPITINEDPLSLLSTLELVEQQPIIGAKEIKVVERESIVLPLYSYKNGKPFVYERSGLNQWHADGRRRDHNEVYIPIPSLIRNKYAGFLPDRDTPFVLHFPDGRSMSVKVSQANSKALMSQHNADLGQWLLRDVLHLSDGELLTYEMLEQIGIDAVEISKIDGEYHIDFKQVGSYEQFIQN